MERMTRLVHESSLQDKAELTALRAMAQTLLARRAEYERARQHRLSHPNMPTEEKRPQSPRSSRSSRHLNSNSSPVRPMTPPVRPELGPTSRSHAVHRVRNTAEINDNRRQYVQRPNSDMVTLADGEPASARLDGGIQATKCPQERGPGEGGSGETTKAAGLSKTYLRETSLSALSSEADESGADTLTIGHQDRSQVHVQKRSGRLLQRLPIWVHKLIDQHGATWRALILEQDAQAVELEAYVVTTLEGSPKSDFNSPDSVPRIYNEAAIFPPRPPRPTATDPSKTGKHVGIGSISSAEPRRPQCRGTRHLYSRATGYAEEDLRRLGLARPACLAEPDVGLPRRHRD